jgi:hypothetical protein
MRKSANAHEWALVGREAGRAGRQAGRQAGGGVECRRRKRGVDDSPVFPRPWGRPARASNPPPLVVVDIYTPRCAPAAQRDRTTIITTTPKKKKKKHHQKKKIREKNHHSGFFPAGCPWSVGFL